ncbi:hypothetical protein NDU88_003575 [Pleurodeles waltl]|uniref:Uncharacterized protein n=1 Tax=Pleurodeles waltl TaxID=8319 RepID=A0AAV7WRR4_PLEWA|nr:hypothetical protein NDU88_003575 [Pleurodeles waltl]
MRTRQHAPYICCLVSKQQRAFCPYGSVRTTRALYVVPLPEQQKASFLDGSVRPTLFVLFPGNRVRSYKIPAGVVAMPT